MEDREFIEMIASIKQKKKDIRDKGLNNKDPFVRKQTEFVDFIEKNLQVLEESDNLNALFVPLSCIEMSPGYVLDDYRSRAETNSRLQLYARNAKTFRPSEEEWIIHQCLTGSCFVSMLDSELSKIVGDEISPINAKERLLELKIKDRSNFPEKLPFLDKLEVPYTRMGMWHAFWLYNSYTLFGMRWHGCYNAGEFIYCKEQLSDKRERRQDKEEIFKKQMQKVPDDFSPIINLDDIGNATIKYYSWNEWSGLSIITVFLTYDFKSRTICDIREESEVIVEYHCGMML